LLDVKNKAKRVPNIAARDLGILLYYGAAGCYELPLRALNVWHKKVKDRPMFFAPFHV
jgi:hypothetical protein